MERLALAITRESFASVFDLRRNISYMVCLDGVEYNDLVTTFPEAGIQGQPAVGSKLHDKDKLTLEAGQFPKPLHHAVVSGAGIGNAKPFAHHLPLRGDDGDLVIPLGYIDPDDKHTTTSSSHSDRQSSCFLQVMPCFDIGGGQAFPHPAHK